MLADQPIAAHLVLRPGEVISGNDVWTPLTALFIFPNGSLGMLFGTAMVQWFLGSELEGFWGTRKYLTLVLGCAVVGHLVSVALAAVVPVVAMTPIGGSNAIDLAAVTAFGVIFGKRPLRLLGALPLTSRTLAMLILGLSLLGPVARGAPWPVILPWLVAIAGALLVTLQPWRRLGDSGKLRKSKRSHLRVVPPDKNLLN